MQSKLPFHAKAPGITSFGDNCCRACRQQEKLAKFHRHHGVPTEKSKVLKKLED